MRKLSVQAFRNERLDFVLEKPLSLDKAPDGHDERAILGGNGLSGYLSELAVIDGQLRLYLSLHNDTNEQCELGISSLYINGKAADVNVEFEGDNKAYYTSCDIPAELTFRVALELDLEELDLQAVLQDLTINFVCQTGDEDWRYATQTQIRPKGEYSFRDLEDTRLTIDELELTAGKAAGEGDPLADPLSFLDPALLVPEDMSQYRVTLGAMIPEERVADFQSAVMLLIIEDDEPSDRIYYIQQLSDVREDGWLLTDYDGLLVRGVGALNPMVTYETARGDDALELSVRGLLLESDFFLGESASYSDISVRADLSADSAEIVSAELERDVYATERFSPSATSADMRRVPTRDEHGELKFVDDWDTGTLYTGSAVPYINGRIKLELLPAQDYYGIKVLFSVRNKDGSGYSLEPMTYEEAIVDGE